MRDLWEILKSGAKDHSEAKEEKSCPCPLMRSFAGRSSSTILNGCPCASPH
ncbi:MAG TPA: hypothetical protein G4O02_18630 [Caldilineae bacterium]|nr:hypothetical protein [Caldilineae bacterium]